MVALSFNASNVAPEYGPEPVPNGWYTAAIDETEMKPTRDGAGAYLQIRFAIREGKYSGRKVFTRLNIQNANATAQQIALGQLSAICHSVGVMNLQDSTQLHGIPMKIRVKLKPADGQYEASNEITSFRDINFIPDATVEAASVAQVSATHAQPAQPAAPPAGWGQPAAPVQTAQPVPVAPVAQPTQAPVAQPAPVAAAPVATPAVQPAQQAPATAAQPWAQPTAAAPVAPTAPAAPAAPAQPAEPVQSVAQTAAPPWAAPQA